MMNKKQSRKWRNKSATKRQEAKQKELSVGASAEPVGPPLEGAALEQAVAEVLCRRYRDTPERKLIRQASRGAKDEAIEAALVSPRVLATVKPVARAHGVEQAISVAWHFLACVRRMAESEKAAAGQSVILKFMMEILLEEPLRQVYGDLFPKEQGTFFTSSFEQSFLDNMRQIFRGQRPPVTAPVPASPETVQSEIPTSTENSDLPGKGEGA